MSEELNEIINQLERGVMGDDEEMIEQPLEISEWLRYKCMNLWDIHNTRSEELDRAARDHPINNRLTTMRTHARTWDKTAIMEYHMGDCLNNGNGAIKWALRSNSKIKALNHRLVEGGISVSPEDMKKDLQYVVKILEANGQDEIKWIFIEDYYNFWDTLDEGALYDI